MTTARVLVLLGVWFALAGAAAAGGAFAGLRPPMPQVMIASLAVAVWLASRRIASLRAWADSVDPRALAVPHLFRALAGLRFLQQASLGLLPAGFAVPAAWGDIAVAVLAAALLASGPIGSRRHARAWLVWNVFGLIDIVLVVLNAARFWIADTGSMSPMLVLPLALLPSFLVPIVLATHALLFTRLSGLRRSLPR